MLNILLQVKTEQVSFKSTGISLKDHIINRLNPNFYLCSGVKSAIFPSEM